MSGFSASFSGIRSSFLRRSVTGNNVANVSTSGFKSSRALEASLGDDSGTHVEAIRTDTSQGSLSPTGRSTDAALEGDGDFVVDLADELTDSRTNRSSLVANVNVQGVRREMTGSLLDLTG